jgi:hypothetical protein
MLLQSSFASGHCRYPSRDPAYGRSSEYIPTCHIMYLEHFVLEAVHKNTAVSYIPATLSYIERCVALTWLVYEAPQISGKVESRSRGRITAFDI